MKWFPMSKRHPQAQSPALSASIKAAERGYATEKQPTPADGPETTHTVGNMPERQREASATAEYGEYSSQATGSASAEADAPVQLREVSFTYPVGGNAALTDVSLTVRRGECVVLCGPSGCGKTTVTRLINGLIPSFFEGMLTGHVETCGLDTAGTPIDALTPLVGSVFQNPKTQYFNADTSDELAFPCENMGWDPARIRERMAEVAARFGVEGLLDRSVFRLSGGQKQRIAVAAAVMLDPPLMVFDEPTSNLDAAAIAHLRGMIARLKSEGRTIVIAEHRLAWLNGIADRYVVFESGRISHDYPAAEFQSLAPERIAGMGLRALDLRPYQARIHHLGPLLLEGAVGVADWGRETVEAGRQSQASAACLSPTRCAGAPSGKRGPRGDTVFSDEHGEVTRPGACAGNLQRETLRVEGLTVGYKGRDPFCRPVPDFALHAGEITGLMGRNGCGKSTLVRTLTGLLKPRAGRILLDGRPASRAALTRAGFLVMQDVNYQLFSDSVREELLLGLDETDPAVIERADQVMADLDLTGLADRHPMSLSGGQKQRVAIASAMMCGKRVVVLDEPTSGLDRLHMEQVGALLRRLADTGMAVLVVTHDEELAAGWCDRILTLDSPDALPAAHANPAYHPDACRASV